MNFWSSIGIGVVSGIIATALSIFLREIYNKIILPWYRHITYKGIDLSGEWRSFIKLGDEEGELFYIYLEQNAHQLTGDATIIKQSNPDKVRNLTFEGETQDGYVVGTFKSKNKRYLFFITTILSFNPTGNELHGLMTARASDSNKFGSSETVWRREI